MILSTRARARGRMRARARAQSPKGEDSMYFLVFPIALRRKYYIFGNPISDLQSARACAWSDARDIANSP